MSINNGCWMNELLSNLVCGFFCVVTLSVDDF